MNTDNFMEEIKLLQCERHDLEIEVKNIRARLAEINIQIEKLQDICPTTHNPGTRCTTCGKTVYGNFK